MQSFERSRCNNTSIFDQGAPTIKPFILQGKEIG